MSNWEIPYVQFISRIQTPVKCLIGKYHVCSLFLGFKHLLMSNWELPYVQFISRIQTSVNV